MPATLLYHRDKYELLALATCSVKCAPGGGTITITNEVQKHHGPIHNSIPCYTSEGEVWHDDFHIFDLSPHVIDLMPRINTREVSVKAHGSFKLYTMPFADIGDEDMNVVHTCVHGWIYRKIKNKWRGANGQVKHDRI